MRADAPLYLGIGKLFAVRLGQHAQAVHYLGWFDPLDGGGHEPCTGRNAGPASAEGAGLMDLGDSWSRN